MTNERTSKKVASAAGRLLRSHVKLRRQWRDLLVGMGDFLTHADDVAEIAASALTQAPDKKKRQRKLRSAKKRK